MQLIHLNHVYSIGALLRKEAARGIEAGVRPRLRLLVYRDGSFRKFALQGGPWTVGQAEDCEITLDDPAVSPHHLVLEMGEDGLRFNDLGATTTTLLDGRKVREGVFAEGSTIVAGGTRMTLERLTSASPVRIAENVFSAHEETVILDRSYLDEDADQEEPVAEIEAAVALLDRLFWSLAETGSNEELASRLLQFALDQTQRERGFLGVYDSAGELSVLASCDRREDGVEFTVSEAVVAEAFTVPRPFFHSTGHGSTPEERVVVPLGSEPWGLLLLESRLSNAPSNRACLRLGKALGEIIRWRLTEAQSREQLRDKIQRLSFHSSPAHATILASARLHPLRRSLKEAGRHDLPLLLIGEEGTEKEDLALYLHVRSSRNLGPFVPFLVAGLPAHRVEDEIFGSAKPVAKDRQAGGALSRARGGTLYIEDPDALPQSVQTRLLHVLENGPDVGAETAAADVRIVASVSEFPKDGASGGMVEGLAKILGKTQVQIPPLCGNADDIGSLAELILSEMGPGPDGRPRVLTEGARRKLLEYRWPGNLRQLRMVLEAAAARSGQQPIAERHLPTDVRNPGGEPADMGLASLREMEKQHVRRVLEAVGGSRSKAAKVLQIATSTLYEKMKRFDLRG